MAIMFLLVHGSLLFLPPLEKIFPFFLILLKQNKNPVVIFPREREEILQQDWVVLVFWERESLFYIFTSLSLRSILRMEGTLNPASRITSHHNDLGTLYFSFTISTG